MNKYTSPVILKSVKEVGEHLGIQRRMLHITSKEMAQKLRVSSDTISRIENGDPGVAFSTILSYARVVGILEQVLWAFNPASTEYGRSQLIRGVKKRVHKT